MDISRVKRLRRSLSMHFIVIAWLTAMLVATGSQSYFLPGLIFCVGIIAYIFVDTLEWFALGRIGSYFLMTLSTCISMASYIYYTVYNPNEAGQLMAVASLLVFPEAVLLLQKKNLRIFEQLAVFLLLEMIVAALVNDNIVFGMLLAPIMLLWVSSLFLFARYATLVYVDPSIESPIPHLAELLYEKFKKRRTARRLKPRVESNVVTAKNVQGSRLARRLLQSVPIGVGAIAFAAFFFYLMPRTSPGSLRRPLVGTPRIGLPRSLTFDAVGRLKVDETPTMRVTLKDATTNDEYPVKTPPYIRAYVLDSYSAPRQRRFDTQGEWLYAGRSEYRSLPDADTTRALLENKTDMVKVEFDIRHKYLKTLVTMGAAFQVDKEPPVRLRLDKFNGVLNGVGEEDAPAGTSVAYEIGTGEFYRGEQLRIVPMHYLNDRENSAGYSNRARMELEYDESFADLEAYALKVLEESGTSPVDAYQACAELERHFSMSGKFAYSLDLTLPEDPTLDPIVDFVLNKRVGHCQYYAAALTAMMRQLSVPTRIVLGYQPREFNRPGRYFAVKQSDAHAWVEGLFRRSQLEQTELAPWLTDREWYLVRFDPTPPSSEDGNVIVDQEGQAFDFAEKLWKDYIVDGQKLKGENSLYAPVAENSRTIVEQLLNDVYGLRNGLRTRGVNASTTLLGPLAVVFVLLVCVALAFWRLFKLLPKYAPRLAKRLGVVPRQAVYRQPYFSRCMKMLETIGLRRTDDQTAEEFSRDADRQLAEQNQDASTELAQGAARTIHQRPVETLANHYYRERFGGQKLSEPDEHEIASALGVLEANLRDAGAKR